MGVHRASFDSLAKWTPGDRAGLGLVECEADEHRVVLHLPPAARDLDRIGVPEPEVVVDAVEEEPFSSSSHSSLSSPLLLFCPVEVEEEEPSSSPSQSSSSLLSPLLPAFLPVELELELAEDEAPPRQRE